MRAVEKHCHIVSTRKYTVREEECSAEQVLFQATSPKAMRQYSLVTINQAEKL